jgi:hypothetical protein
VFADFLYHVRKQKRSGQVQTQELTDGIAREVSLCFRDRIPGHVSEGHHPRAFEGDPVYQSFLPQAIERCHNRYIGSSDLGAVPEFAYRDTIRLLPHSGQNPLFKGTKPDFTRR